MFENGPLNDSPSEGEKDYKSRGLPPENGFTLIIGPDNGIIDNADVRVRWCITPELTKYLESKDVRNPHVVLATYTPDGKHEWRGVFPLNELMSFARFYKAGKMNITAFIVDLTEDTSTKRGLRLKWTKHDYEGFNHGIQHGGSCYRKVDDGYDILAATEDTAIIPEGVFSKEPPAWLDWFVNVWHGKHKNDDGCEFRRRAMLAFSVKWIFMAVWAVTVMFSSALFVALLYGAGLKVWINNIRAILYPFDSRLMTMIDPSKGEHGNLRDSSFVFHIKWGRRVTQPVLSLLFLTPSVILSIFLISFSAYEHGSFILDFYSAHKFVTWFTIIVGGLAVFFEACVAVMNAIAIRLGNDVYRDIDDMVKEGGMLFGCSLVILFGILLMPWWGIPLIASIIGILIVAIQLSDAEHKNNILKGYFRFIDGIGEWAYKYFGPKETYGEMRELLCPQDKLNLSTDINKIPTENISWLLRYRNLKSMVCKPRQRR